MVMIWHTTRYTMASPWALCISCVVIFVPCSKNRCNKQRGACWPYMAVVMMVVMHVVAGHDHHYDATCTMVVMVLLLYIMRHSCSWYACPCSYRNSQSTQSHLVPPQPMPLMLVIGPYLTCATATFMSCSIRPHRIRLCSVCEGINEKESEGPGWRRRLHKQDGHATM